MKKNIKRYSHQVKDIDESGQVKFYFAAFGNKDSDGDIIMPGSYTKTMKENASRIKHLRNHDETVGVIKEMGQDEHGAWAVSQLSLNSFEGKDTYGQYKDGIITEHSHGFNIIKESFDKAKDANVITEIKLWEVSSLTHWGANENTPTAWVKGMNDLCTEKEFLTLQLQIRSFVKSNKVTPETVKQLKELYEELNSLLDSQPSNDTNPDEEPKGKQKELSATELFINSLK